MGTCILFRPTRARSIYFPILVHFFCVSELKKKKNRLEFFKPGVDLTDLTINIVRKSDYFPEGTILIGVCTRRGKMFFSHFARCKSAQQKIDNIFFCIFSEYLS